jgi:hypothetical protein
MPLHAKNLPGRKTDLLTDQRDAADLANLLRMNRLPEAWIAPPASRELSELVRHRAKLVRLRSSLKCQVHAVLAGAGVPVARTDLFGAQGRELLDRVRLAPAMRARADSCLRLIADIDVEIDTFGQLAGNRLRHDPGYAAVQTIPGIGPTLGAVFVAEIGDVRRFRGPTQLTSWAGLTPRHRESEPPCTAGGSPSRGPGWSAGPRSRRCSAAAPAPGSAPTGSGSPNVAAATRARSLPPASSSSACSTRFAITTFAVSTTHRPAPPRPHEPSVRGCTREVGTTLTPSGARSSK